MKKKEIWILVVIAAAAIAGMIFLGNRQSAGNGGGKGDVASSTADPDDPYASAVKPDAAPKGQWVALIHRNRVAIWFDSGVDAEYQWTGDYGVMTVEVKDGKWCVESVECPNQICKSMGWDDGTNLVPITCLPNNIIIVTEDMAQNYLNNN